MSPHETDAHIWLVKTLDQDATLTQACPGGVHRHPAPPKTPYPVITYEPVGSPDVVTVDGHRAMVRGLWRVAIWYEAHNAEPLAAVRHMDDILHRGAGVENGHRVRAHRDRSWTSAKAPTSGNQIYAIGGWYRFEISL